MNGNPMAQGPMPHPPPPHPFPNAGPQYHRGPPHQQMPPQGSPHLQNFPSPGDASHHGPPQHGAHQNMPSNAGQNHPMPMHQDGIRILGRRQSFDGLTDRLDKLNIDPTGPKKRKGPMEQDVVDVKPPTRTNADSPITYEGWTFLKAEPESADQTPTWARATKTPMRLSQDELAKLVQKRKKKGQAAADQYKALGALRRLQVDRLIEDRKRQDADPRFEWHFMYVDSKEKDVRHNLFEVRYEITAMDVIIMKKLRPDAPIIKTPKATGKRAPKVVDIHTPGTPIEDSDSEFDMPRGVNKHAAQPFAAIPINKNQGPPQLRRDVTMGPDRPLQGMPQGGQPPHQRPQGEQIPRVQILTPQEENQYGQEGRFHDMPRGGPPPQQRAPEMSPHPQHQQAQGHNPHGPQGHPQQPHPMSPHGQHPQNFPGPDRRMPGMPQGGPLPQQQPQQQQQPQPQPQQRGPPDMSHPGMDPRMQGMPRGGPQPHQQGHPMNIPHAPAPPPTTRNFHDGNNGGQNRPIEVMNGGGQQPQRNPNQRHSLPQQMPQIIKDFPKEHQRQKHVTPKVVNLSGKSPKNKGFEDWQDDESSLDEDDSELFEDFEDDSSATEASYNVDEKFERHIPGRGSLHPARRSSRNGRNEPGYRNHRRTGHKYTGSDGQRYRYLRDSVDIVPARTGRALAAPPTRRASIAGPVRPPPRLVYPDRVDRRDPLTTLAGANLSSGRYNPRELDYAADDRDLDLERDRDFDLTYNEYMRSKMQNANNEILLRRRAAQEAEYREFKEAERMEHLERMDRLQRRPLRDPPRYPGRGYMDYE
ncbi:hypothetical protein FQN54_006373 [Arachnomyces sp. PD_36]|nr:hypothetical protein FQN54_006373 [Arachnomyces sp. PD_36]